MDADGLSALGVRDVAPDPEAARTGFSLRGELDPEHLVATAGAYKADGYTLESVTAVDREEFREVWYQFNRLGALDRQLMRVQVDPTSETLPTLSGVYGSALWFERDAFDMLGVSFAGHPNLKRLLLPEDADFHPLRRDQCLDEVWAAKRVAQRAKREKAAARAAAKAEAAKAAAAEAEAAE